MKTALIVVAVVIAIPFVIGFSWAAISWMFGSTQKRERAEAMVLLSQLPDEALEVLRRVFRGFESEDVKQVNRQVEEHRSETGRLVQVLARPRSVRSSAGAFGDALNLTVWEKGLVDRGYSQNAAALISAVYHHHLDAVLDSARARGQSDDPVSRSSKQPPAAAVPASDASAGEPSPDMPPLPEWLEEKATSGPTMVRVLVDTIDLKLRREYPQVLSCPEWHRFREIGTIAGCVALALRLHVDVPQAYRTPLELAMRKSLDMGFPGSEPKYEDCARSVREALLEVERPKRSAAIFVLVSMWVFGMLDSDDSLSGDPQLAAELAQLYQNESYNYWATGEADGP